uniref:Peptidase A1 domain-containing protein n=1 Tax=Meloidogyne javanica TaxID=6303 RepID=A0A915MKJ9_MELJA
MPKTPSIFNFLLLLPFLFQSSLTGIIPQTSSNNVVSIQMDRINYKKCGVINVGGQNVTLTFATGLSDFWIVKEKQSESLLKPLNKLVEIKDAGIKGPLVNSQVSISNVKITNVPLVVFTSKPAAYSSSLANIGGLLGLSSDPNTKSPLQYLTQNLPKPILTFYTKSNGKLQIASQNEQDVGFITFGGEDNTNCGEYSYAPLIKTSDWSVNVQCVKVGDTECAGTKNKTMTILDDELLMLAPQQVVEQIAKIMKLKPFGGDEDNSGMYVFPQGSCEAKNIAKLPTITITVGDPDDCEKQAIINITPRQYLQYVGLYTGGPQYKIVSELDTPKVYYILPDGWMGAP